MLTELETELTNLKNETRQMISLENIAQTFNVNPKSWFAYQTFICLNDAVLLPEEKQVYEDIVSKLVEIENLKVKKMSSLIIDATTTQEGKETTEEKEVCEESESEAETTANC
jgi:hypothetical protein